MLPRASSLTRQLSLSQMTALTPASYSTFQSRALMSVMVACGTSRPGLHNAACSSETKAGVLTMLVASRDADLVRRGVGMGGFG